MLEFLDTILRGMTLGALLLTGVRIGIRHPSAPALAACLATYVIVSSSLIETHQHPVFASLRQVPLLNPFLIWWFGQSVFDDRFRLRPLHLILVVLVVLPAHLEPIDFVRPVIVAGLYLHLAYVALATARDDLVPSRIAFRSWFFVLSALTGLIILGVELSLNGPAGTTLLLLQAGALAVLTSAFALWITALQTDLWAPDQAALQAPPSDLSPQEAALLKRLSQVMDDGIWRRENLTIGQLANAVGAPDHRLRALINRTLGHRNFAAFINERRIAAAKSALRDPDRAEDQILTIAHESGFASLGPFNRAFRAQTGTSPSEYRTAARRN